MMLGSLNRLSKEAFKEELTNVAQHIDSWALDFVDVCGKSRSAALMLGGTGKDKVRELEELLNNLDGEYVRLQAALGDQQEALARYLEWTDKVKARDSQLVDRINNLLETKRRGEDKVSVAMAEISSKLDHRKQKLDALRKATCWYKELLGIRCEYSNAVKFIFTNIDPANQIGSFLSPYIMTKKPTDSQWLTATLTSTKVGPYWTL